MSVSNRFGDEFRYDLSVVGLGYVGRPLLEAAANAGLHAIGYDNSPERVSQIKEDLSSSSAADKSQVLGLASFEATTNPNLISQSRYIAICVPTPTDSNHNPSLEYVIDASTVVGVHLRRGQTVILESTVAPGTTEGLLREILEKTSGLNAETDFHLVFSPERIDPGNHAFTITNTPKILGGLLPCCAESAESLYSAFVSKIFRAKGCREAEAAKLLENSYRHVNIAFINEFSLACMNLGIDVFDVIRMAETKPFGFKSFFPSVGAGGHCIPVDPNYFGSAYFEATGKSLQFLAAANTVNDKMPVIFRDLAKDALRELEVPIERAVILIMGLAYKADVPDMRESPGFKLAKDLISSVGQLVVHDPYVDGLEISREFDNVVDSEVLVATIESADLVIILQPHGEYLHLRNSLRHFSGKILSPLDPLIFHNRFGFSRLV